jgi:hypothetical protein
MGSDWSSEGVLWSFFLQTCFFGGDLFGVTGSEYWDGMRTMSGSRIGGWSLPGVMSDWKRCVDLLLAKYCRCRLRRDWCWCGWRLSVEGHCRWGLQVWRRQVGLVRGTRWPAESSAGRKVARTAGRSRGRFLGWASKPKSSLKTKVESGLRGSRVMSGDWRRLHRVRGVCSGSPENH